MRSSIAGCSPASDRQAFKTQGDHNLKVWAGVIFPGKGSGNSLSLCILIYIALSRSFLPLFALACDFLPWLWGTWRSGLSCTNTRATITLKGFLRFHSVATSSFTKSWLVINHSACCVTLSLKRFTGPLIFILFFHSTHTLSLSLIHTTTQNHIHPYTAKTIFNLPVLMIHKVHPPEWFCSTG
jgi:hypothetical protein